MDFKRLKVFVTVVQTGGFGAAARVLNMAQPAVTKKVGGKKKAKKKAKKKGKKKAAA